MADDWVVVANSSRCRFFSQGSRHGPLEEGFSLTSPRSRLQGKDIYADRPGRSFDSAGEGRHALSRPVDIEEQEATRFAKEIAERLDAARKKQRFDRLILIAEPRFLGYLRAALRRPLQNTVSAEINKDFTEQDAETIRQRVRDELFGS